MGCVGEWWDTTWRGDTVGRYMERHGVDALEFCGQEVSGGMQWLTDSVGKVRSQTDWDPVQTGPNPAVPVPVWDFPKNSGLLGLRSGHSHIAQDHLRPSLDQDRITYISNMLILYF